MTGEISRLEILDAVSDAMIYHASKAIMLKLDNALNQADEHMRETDRLRMLRTRLMAGEPLEAVA